MPEPEEIVVECTKDDEFLVKPCECPECTEKRAEIYNSYADQPTIITDELLSPQIVDKWSGHNFKCPKCAMNTIMHYFNFCPNCGLKIAVKSKTATAFIREYQDKGLIY